MSTHNNYKFPEWDYTTSTYDRKSEVIEREYQKQSSAELKKYEESFGRMANVLSNDMGRFKSRKNKLERRTKRIGKLNSRYVYDELKRLYAGEEFTQKIYDRRTPKYLEEITNGRVVGLLLDQSGSTRFKTEDNYQRIELIKYAALTLGRSLNSADDKYFMYSFHSARYVHPTYLERLKSVEDEWSESIEKKIASIEHTADTEEFNNVDGAAIRYMNAEMKKYDELNKIIFLLTDGNPNTDYEYYKDNYAFEDTKKAMEEGKAEGIHYVYLTINPESNADKFLKIIEHATDFSKRFSDMKQVVEGLTIVYERIREGKIGAV